ncbi:MAG: heme peroxidase family protein [Myxococcota bacterium]
MPDLLTMTHHGGQPKDKTEVLYNSRFDYLFPEAARDEKSLVDATNAVANLKALADVMADPGQPADPGTVLDSAIPAAMTYLGQFIDHDITARTDRDEGQFVIGGDGPSAPIDPNLVVATLRNGRRPTLDLDSVFADGPGLSPNATSVAEKVRGIGLYYERRLRLRRTGRTVDLRRVPVPPETTGGDTVHAAVIADARNDENIMISQLHAAFHALYNRVFRRLSAPLYDTPEKKHVRARQLVRWAFQYVVVHEYLREVCDPSVAMDIVANGPRFLGPASSRAGTFMPLEFSVAGFRFAHSMIRPSYRLNASTPAPEPINELLGFSEKARFFDTSLSPVELKPEFRIDWDFFVRGGDMLQQARRLDPRIAQGLFALPFGGSDQVLRSLARRNLLRSFLLSIPTGQTMARCFGIVPLTPAEMKTDPDLAPVLSQGQLDTRTPLWFYVLQEAKVQQDGQRLGEVGSRIVAETLYSLVVNDPGAYIFHRHDPAVTPTGIGVPAGPGAGGTIATLSDFLERANVHS